MLIDTPLGQHLLAEGLISQEQLDVALHHHEAHRMRLGSAIVELGYVSLERVSDVLARQLCVPSLTPQDVARDGLDFSLLSPLQALEMRALPYESIGGPS